MVILIYNKPGNGKRGVLNDKKLVSLVIVKLASGVRNLKECHLTGL